MASQLFRIFDPENAGHLELAKTWISQPDLRNRVTVHLGDYIGEGRLAEFRHTLRPILWRVGNLLRQLRLGLLVKHDGPARLKAKCRSASARAFPIDVYRAAEQLNLDLSIREIGHVEDRAARDHLRVSGIDDEGARFMGHVEPSPTMFEPKLPLGLSKIDPDNRVGVDSQYGAIGQFHRPDFSKPRGILNGIGFPGYFDGRRVETAIAGKDRHGDHSPCYKSDHRSDADGHHPDSFGGTANRLRGGEIGCGRETLSVPVSRPNGPMGACCLAELGYEECGEARRLDKGTRSGPAECGEAGAMTVLAAVCLAVGTGGLVWLVRPP